MTAGFGVILFLFELPAVLPEALCVAIHGIVPWHFLAVCIADWYCVLL